MFAEIPPPPESPPALTAQQESDLACLRVGFFLTTISKGAGGNMQGDRLVRFYLPRLQRSDGERDWMALAKPPNDLAYGTFMGLMDRCLPRRRR